MQNTSPNISIYIHWPFCLSLCPYCDFNSHISASIDHARWLKAYEKELEYFTSTLKNKQIKSIFFGGGTPSLMQPFVVEGIINKIASLGQLNDLCEITLEANPTSFETNKFKDFKKAGVNRVSLGIQALNKEDLLTLGRKHSSEEAISAIKSASKIFSRYSFDLIYARPSQTLDAWKNELKFALQLAGSHISLYQLTIEKGTPFFNLFRQGKLKLPEEELSATLYEWTNDFLETNNYSRYEISNYAFKDQECLHNLCYWNYNEYIGIGAGAHSRIHNKTISEQQTEINALMMYHKPEKWLNSVEEQGHGIQYNNKLTKTEIIQELIMMGTRLSSGIKEAKLLDLMNLKFADVLNYDILNHYINNNLASLSNDVLKLSDKGLLLHNYLISRCLA